MQKDTQISSLPITIFLYNSIENYQLDMTLFLLFMVILLSQCGSFTAMAYTSRQPAFESVTEHTGIAMTDITSMTYDDDGFIWAASRMGIMRATPSDSRLYELPVSTSDVMQVKIAYGGDGLLAVSTQNGQIFRYDPIRDCFVKWFSLYDILGNKDWVTNFLIDKTGKVWISTSVGIFTNVGDKLERLHISGEKYSYLLELSSGRLFAIVGGEIFEIENNGSKVIRLPGQLLPYISSGVYDPTTQRVWLGTYQGELYQYNMISRKLINASVDVLPELIIRSILVASPESLLVGMEGGGIIVLDVEKNQVKKILKDDVDDPGSLKGNSVYSMLIDDQQRLWTATTSGGLQYAESEVTSVEHIVHAVNNPSSLHNNEVNCLMVDKKGNLWVGTNDGISYREASKGGWRQFYRGRQLSVLSLTQDKEGLIYATTYGNGVFILDADTGKELQHFNESKADIFGSGAFVFASLTDSDGDIWFGGVKGNVVCYSPSTRQFRTYDSYPVFCLAEQTPGIILTGGGDGLISIDKRSGESRVLLNDNVVQSIAPDKDMVWICTAGNGVIGKNLETGDEIRLTTKEGLHSNFARGILIDGDNLWISTTLGMSCYNKKEGIMRSLPGQEILTKMSFRENVACRFPDGRLAFGSNDGIVAFYPDKVIDTKTQAKMFISDIRVAGRSIKEYPEGKLSAPVNKLEELCLEYPDNSFTLSVLPLGNIGSNVGYSWIMEGQDKEWSEISATPYINYVNLRPGHYTLRMRMHDGGIVSERNLKVSVRPPFWQTGWFRALIILSIIGLVILLVRHYIWRIRRRYTFEKIRFYTRMAHDLRSSLMLIKAPLGELKKENGLSDWGKECIGVVDEQANRLVDTVTQLLDFEKADVGAEQPNFVKIDLISLLKRRVEAYESLAASKGISINADFIPGEYITEVDKLMIEHVIDNLLSNAVKYSASGSKITVTFKGTGLNWILKVKDEGIGIPKNDLKKLFKEFYRAENAVNSQVMGSGIGLLSVKRYIDIHGGTVTVDSESGKGTLFSIEVPQRLLVEDKEDKGIKLSKIDNENPDVTADDAISEDIMSVLVVEDNETLRDFLVKALQTRFKVETASDGREAWDIISDLQPDLVLSDVMMPHMDGFELCRLIKTTYSTSHIPVILLTALDDKPNQIRGLELGADNYLAKPFDMELLAERISSIVKNRRSVAGKAMESVRGEVESPIVENDINDDFLKKAVECVMENISNESFGKADFAMAMMISQSLLYKKIKALTDMSVVEFIRSIRLNQAMTLLQGGRNNVTEVSEMCGFSSSAYFSRVFKEHFGKNPSEFIP